MTTRKTITARHTARLSAQTVRFKAGALPGLGVDTLSLVQLRQRGSPQHLAAVQRLDFLMFVLYTAGTSEHMVDLERYPVKAGTLIVVQPGNLHQFQINNSIQGQLLVVDPQFMLPERLAYLKPLLAGRPWPVCSQLSNSGVGELLEICRHIQGDALRHADPALLAALARQRLYTWLLLLRMLWETDHESRQSDSATAHLAQEFQALLEQHFTQKWTVQDYARKLGYAERTVTRACLHYSGGTAKALIDARLVLEAKRLLAHGDDSIEAVSTRLGFDESSPLVRFFKRMTGTTPNAFRTALRSPANQDH